MRATPVVGGNHALLNVLLAIYHLRAALDIEGRPLHARAPRALFLDHVHHTMPGMLATTVRRRRAPLRVEARAFCAAGLRALFHSHAVLRR